MLVHVERLSDIREVGIEAPVQNVSARTDYKLNAGEDRCTCLWDYFLRKIQGCKFRLLAR